MSVPVPTALRATIKDCLDRARSPGLFLSRGFFTQLIPQQEPVFPDVADVEGV
ncbi:hypothetical protein GCK32_007151, partial [Trichostrongylus colubriformis]